MVCGADRGLAMWALCLLGVVRWTQAVVVGAQQSAILESTHAATEAEGSDDVLQLSQRRVFFCQGCWRLFEYPSIPAEGDGEVRYMRSEEAFRCNRCERSLCWACVPRLGLPRCPCEAAARAGRPVDDAPSTVCRMLTRTLEEDATDRPHPHASSSSATPTPLFLGVPLPPPLPPGLSPAHSLQPLPPPPPPPAVHHAVSETPFVNLDPWPGWWQEPRDEEMPPPPPPVHGPPADFVDNVPPLSTGEEDVPPPPPSLPPPPPAHLFVEDRTGFLPFRQPQGAHQPLPVIANAN